MPSQPQNKARKSLRGSRRFTTLSFESIDKINQGIFTEDISSSSRVPRPSYVLRQGDVVGANMPETIKLAKHRGKIYVGLHDGSSVCSSKEARSLSRERSSAATTIGRASIIDWADNASDVSGKVQLSGELSFILPPVPGAQQTNQPPPGLDTSEIFNYKTVSYHNTTISNSNSLNPYKRHVERSPRPPPSRGAVRYVGGFRTPQNTPFLCPSRADDFSASIRKKVTPRTPRDSSNVMILGGGITPIPSSRQETHRPLMSRENTFARGRRSRKGSKNVPNLGTANFDLPMIDLKCVESPIPNLGNLEEKGIRLVKLRKVKRSRRKSEGVNGTSSDTSPPDTCKRNSVNEETGKDPGDRAPSFQPHPPPTSREETMTKSPAMEKLHLEQTISEKTNEAETNRSHKSITTSSSSSDVFQPKTDEEDKQSEIGTNREPYSTPLLPNVETSRTDKDATAPTLLLPNTETSRTDKSNGLNSPVIQVTTEPEVFQPPSGQPILLTVEKVDVTPDPPTPLPVITDSDDNLEKGRRSKRSSSLLSVPTSDVSEIRPRMLSESELRPPMVGEEKDLGHERRDVKSVVVETEDEDLSRTIATQTMPLIEQTVVIKHE